jgi:hypothetical protein
VRLDKPKHLQMVEQVLDKPKPQDRSLKRMRLAICVTIKNRSRVVVAHEDTFSLLPVDLQMQVIAAPPSCRIPADKEGEDYVLQLFPRLVKSLLATKKPTDDWVLVVVDYQSTDIQMRPFLEETIGDKMAWHLETVTDYPFFDRGGGLKKGLEIAEGKFQADSVLFCDADLMFTDHLFFDRLEQVVSQNLFFYPVFFSFYSPEHTMGIWRETSFGNFACRIEDYKKTEGWYHNISWGWEDRALADSIPGNKKIRERVPGFYHQWHPVSLEFRNQEYPVKQYLFMDAAVKHLPC